MTALLPAALAVLAGLLCGASAICAFGTLRGAALHLRERALAIPAAAGRGVAFARLSGLVFAPVGSAVCARVPPGIRAAIERLIARAGRPLELAVPEVAGIALVGCATGTLAGGAAGALIGLAPLLGGLGASAGFAAPLLWLGDAARLRSKRIERALPASLDLLTLSVEAGLDFAAALARVAERGKGPLADELSLAVRQLKLGKTREEALRALAARVGLVSLRAFVQALVQADRMGTPLGRTLRILSSQLRAERAERAEKLANEAPVKLLLPLLGCIFPTLFLMLFGPIAYDSFFSGGG